MKARLAFITLLVAVLVLVAGSGEAVAQVGGNKTTGGGWFINEAFGDLSGHRITFGFNAHRTSEESSVAAAKGEFQLVDHDFNTTIHGTFTTVVGAGSNSVFWGMCSIDGEGGYTLSIWCLDGGEPGMGSDNIKITIFGKGVFLLYWAGLDGGNIDGGNIQIHQM